MHGYQIIQELTERTGGVWRPSPGSVYPTLQQLEDEELVRETASDSGKRVYELTDAGREQAVGGDRAVDGGRRGERRRARRAPRPRAPRHGRDAAGRPRRHDRAGRSGAGRPARRAAQPLPAARRRGLTRPRGHAPVASASAASATRSAASRCAPRCEPATARRGRRCATPSGSSLQSPRRRRRPRRASPRVRASART